MPETSVIMPAYNSELHIREAIESVLTQTYSDLELLVVDDHSTDSTFKILDEYADNDRVTIFRNGYNLGAGPSRNVALENAAGRYIAFVDADDLWTPDKLQIQIDQMKAFRFGFSYTAYTLIDSAGNLIGDSGTLPRVTNYSKLLSGCIAQNSTVVLDRNIVGDDIMCPDIRRRQDFGLFLAALKRIPSGHLIESSKPTCSYRIVPGSLSSDKYQNIRYQWEIYRDVEKLGFLRSVYHLSRWFAYAGHKNLRRRYQNMTRTR